MYRLLLLFPFLIFQLIIQAQDKLPAFGKIDKADLEMKDCDFDPGAEAMVLFDVGEIEIKFIQFTGWVSESAYRVRIKVLKPGGVKRAEIKLRYYSKNRVQEIINVSGISFNLDQSGNIEETKLESKSVYYRSVDNENSEVSFAIPNVKAGTVFEYKYKYLRKSFSYIPTWYFQSQIPVKYSAYNLVIPEYFLFTVQATIRQQMEEQKKNQADNGKWYILRNIPGIKEEPYSAGTKDYTQRIEFKLSSINTPTFNQDFRTTWPKIIEELLEDEDFGKVLKKNLKGNSELYAQLVSIGSVKERIRTIYKYVQRNMQWDESHGIYSFTGIKDAWDKKSGSVTDINFILIRFLRDAGIDAMPLLVSTKDNGVINSFYPFLNQFKGVLAYVVNGDETYVMNAADKYNPFHLIPYDVLYTYALVVDKATGGIVKLENNNAADNNIFLTCSIGDDGKLSGQATVKSSDYARNIRLESVKKNQLKDRFEDNTGITIKADSLEILNEEDELLPLEQKISFSGSLQSSGDYYFLPYHVFTSLGKNPFISEERVTDIDFNFPKKYTVSGSWFLPDNLAADALPKNTKIILPDTSIVLTRMIQNEGNIISFRFVLDFRASGYAAESYPYIKEFFKQLYLILDERIVLKKK